MPGPCYATLEWRRGTAEVLLRVAAGLLARSALIPLLAALVALLPALIALVPLLVAAALPLLILLVALLLLATLIALVALLAALVALLAALVALAALTLLAAAAVLALLLLLVTVLLVVRHKTSGWKLPFLDGARRQQSRAPEVLRSVRAFVAPGGRLCVRTKHLFRCKAHAARLCLMACAFLHGTRASRTNAAALTEAFTPPVLMHRDRARW